jgi:hypothetical protein
MCATTSVAETNCLQWKAKDPCKSLKHHKPSRPDTARSTFISKVTASNKGAGPILPAWQRKNIYTGWERSWDVQSGGYLFTPQTMGSRCTTLLMEFPFLQLKPDDRPGCATPLLPLLLPVSLNAHPCNLPETDIWTHNVKLAPRLSVVTASCALLPSGRA